ncbi:hypothetical protein TrST_g2483 [Triparma strigata]|uniref:Uncharacterized protein n=1 Tax=Triparma strigata TaxID=1606541 RepID=A0A9W7A1X5_9STRA|nr:hypothetical protein TrST_g2483 [Triparma strigata]
MTVGDDDKVIWGASSLRFTSSFGCSIGIFTVEVTGVTGVTGGGEALIASCLSKTLEVTVEVDKGGGGSEDDNGGGGRNDLEAAVDDDDEACGGFEFVDNGGFRWVERGGGGSI